MPVDVETIAPRVERDQTAVAVLLAVSASHLLNDTIQSLLPAIYPVLKATFSLSFAQVGLMTLALMLTASVLQPLVGLYTDRHPQPYALSFGMGWSAAGSGRCPFGVSPWRNPPFASPVTTSTSTSRTLRRWEENMPKLYGDELNAPASCAAHLQRSCRRSS